MPKEQIEVKSHIDNWNKTIAHAIDNWNNAKADPIAAVKSGDKLAELLAKSKHTTFIADEFGDAITLDQINFVKQRVKENK